MINSSNIVTSINLFSFAEFGSQDYEVFALEFGLQLEFYLYLHLLRLVGNRYNTMQQCITVAQLVEQECVCEIYIGAGSKLQDVI